MNIFGKRRSMSSRARLAAYEALIFPASMWLKIADLARANRPNETSATSRPASDMLGGKSS